MRRDSLEIVMGGVVVVITVLFLVFAYSSGEVRPATGYQVTAKFDHIEGTRSGGDVRISGIKVGTILSQSLDPKTFQAIVSMNIDPTIKLPIDTVATITSSGLLGDKFMQLIPGADDKNIAPGGEIKFTQAPVSLEAMLGQFVFSLTSGNKSSDSGSPPTAPAPTPSHGGQ